MTQVKLLLLIVIGANFLDIEFTYGGQQGGGGGGSPGETGYQGGGQQGGGQQGGGQQGGGQQGGGQQGGGQQGGGQQGGGQQGGGQQGGGQQGGGQQGGGQQGGGQQDGGQQGGWYQGGGQQGGGHQGGVQHGGGHQGGGHQDGGHQGGGHQGSGHQGGGHQGSGHQGGGHQGSGHQGGGNHGGGHQGGGHQGGGHQGGGHQGGLHQGGWHQGGGQQGGWHQDSGHQGGWHQGGGQQGSGQQGSGQQGGGQQGGGQQGDGHKGGWYQVGVGQHGGGQQGSGQHDGGYLGNGHHGAGPPGAPWHHRGGLAGGLSGVTLDRESVFPRCLLEQFSSFLTENGTPGSSNVTSHIPRCRLDHNFDCAQQWPALGLSWRADSQGRMMEGTLTKGKPKCPLAKVSRKALVCVPGEKIIHCKRGTTLSVLDIKLSRSAGPGDMCHHRGRNEENSTLPSDHRCNATKVIGKIHKRCQGRRECRINLNERNIGNACVMEVKFLRVNFTCDQRDNNVTEESEIKEDPMYRRWDDMDDICTNDVDFDDDDDIFRSSGDSGMDSDRDDYDDSFGDYNDDDDDHDNFFLDDNDDVGDTFEDDAVRFHFMDILRSSNMLNGMRRGVERGRQHCPRLNWLEEPDLYKEFDFNPPSVCPKNEPVQSKCSPNLCKLVMCGDDKNVSCRVNPCGYCRPECYDVKGNRVQNPRALTKCENKRLEIKYRHSDEISAVPRCNEDGSFAEIQCLPKVNKCWCVDEHGRERNGTRQTGKPTNCKASGPVLSSCQSSILNIKTLKKQLRKMAANYNETAKTLKSKAENMTQWVQQQPSQQRNQSRSHHQRYIRHQMNRARMCRVVARNTMKVVKHIAEPKCDADGNYETIQCEASGKWCWCVNENGKRVGSMKLLKKLNCSSTDKGRERLCPSVSSFRSGQAQNIPSSCRNDSDCSDSKVCCKTSRRERACVDPSPKMPEIKPGRCPEMPNSMNYSCPSKCKTDADCRGDMKCCGMGCGKRCIPANKPVCPKGKPFKLCIYDKCLSSPGCPSHSSACCRMNYCGGCTAEYFDENGRKIDCAKATQCQRQRHKATENYKRKFLQVYGTMPHGVPGSHQERNKTMQAGRHRGNQGGRQEDNHGRRQWNGNQGSHGGMPGGDDRGEHDDGQNGQLGDSQQRRNGGRRQGGRQSGVHSGIQHSNQSSSDGRQHGGGHTSGQGQGSGGDHSGRNSGEQNVPAGGRGRQTQDQRRQPDLGIFIPECNPKDGAFSAEQCNVTAGVCWCVDEKGHEIPNTRARVQPGTRDCKVTLTKSSEKSKGVHGQKPKGNRKTKSAGKVSFRLEGNFDEALKNKDKFIKNVKKAVVSVTKIKEEQIQKVEISRGSVKVQLEIVEEEDSTPLNEIVENLQTVVQSRAFVVKMDDKEYRSDGTFHAEVHNRRPDDTVMNDDAVHKRQLSAVETIAIGSCAAVCLLGTAVFVWKFYCRGRKKLQPEGWKDMVEKKPPEVQYYTPDVVPVVTTNMTPSSKVPQFSRGKAAEAMPEPSI